MGFGNALDIALALVYYLNIVRFIVCYNCACKRNQTEEQMALPVSFYDIKIFDNTIKPNGNPESTSFSVPIATVNAGNFAATLTALGVLRSAVQGVILGNIASDTLIADRVVRSNAAASSRLAQRENKWRVLAHDVTTSQKFSFSIGTADLTQLVPNTEKLDTSSGTPGADLVTAINATVVSPYNSSDGVAVDDIIFVGRNS